MGRIKIKNLSFTYHHGTPNVLSAINVSFTMGHFALLTGPSGCGKSTLLKLLAGLYPDYAGTIESGTIEFNSRSIQDFAPQQRSKQVALLFQNPAQQFAMPTVMEELIFALENQQVPQAEIAERCQVALKEVGMDGFQQRTINKLSGGEQQKVALAVILAMNSQVVLLDEPFASIDPQARQQLLATLRRICDQQGKTIILADHDLDGYTELIDDLFVMEQGSTPQLLTGQARDNHFSAFAKNRTLDWSLTLPTAQLTSSFTLDSVSIQQQRMLLTTTDLKIPKDAVTLLTGANGIGKSTFLDVLVKLHAYQGQLRYQQRDLRRWRGRQYAHQVGLLFQSATTQFLSVTVAEELELSRLHSNGDYFTKARIQAAMQQLQIADYGQRGLYELSDGQQKKVQILSMLIMQSPVLLLDEPLRGLDLASIHALVQLLLQIRLATYQTMLMVSHQLTGLQPLIDFQLVFADQKLMYREGRQ